MIAGCSASAVSRTEAPISSVFTSALMVDSSATRFMSISTGGATMPRRIFTTRSVPPPSGMLPGLAARAASASSSVAGLSMRKSGRASINLSPLAKNECSSHEPQQTPSPLVGEGWGGGWWRSAKLHHPPPPPLPTRGRGTATASAQINQKPSRSASIPLAPPLLNRLEHAVGRHRQIVEADADGVGDGIGQRRQERGERAFARLLGAEGAVWVHALDDADFDRRGIPDGRNTVIEHIGGEHQPIVIGGFLAHGLAHPHPDRALHLAFHRQTIERLAAVVRDPDSVDGDDTGVLIDADLDHLRRIAVAHGAADGGAAIFLAAVRFRNGRIIAGHRDGAGIFERLGHHLVERGALVLRAGAIELAQAFDVFRPRL